MKRKILDFLRLFWTLPGMERVLVSLTSKQVYGSALSKMAPNHYQYPKNSLRTVSRDGINYQLDLSDIVDWFIYFGFVELSRQNLYRLINTGDTVIDIGTNVGDVSLHAAKMVGKTGQVHSFEPDPENFRRFMRNLELNSFENIHQNNMGLGDQPGSFLLRKVNENNQGMNKIVSEADPANSVKIDVVDFDSYASDKGISKIDLIKIDVEGFEHKVLLGADRILKKQLPKLFIEVDDRNLKEQGSSARKLVQYLEALGYSIVHSETKELLSSNSDFENCHYDIIALDSREQSSKN